MDGEYTYSFPSFLVDPIPLLHLSDDISNLGEIAHHEDQLTRGTSANHMFKSPSLNWQNTLGLQSRIPPFMVDDRLQHIPSGDDAQPLPSRFLYPISGNSQPLPSIPPPPIVSGPMGNGGAAFTSILRSLNRNTLEFIQQEIATILRHGDPPPDAGTVIHEGNPSPTTRMLAMIQELQQENNKLRSLVQQISNLTQTTSNQDVVLSTSPVCVSTPLSPSPIMESSEKSKRGGASSSDEGEKRPFACPMEDCGKAFSKLSRLKRHKVTHDDNRVRFYCAHPGCLRSYGTKYDLSAHEKQKHQDAISTPSEQASESKPKPKRSKKDFRRLVFSLSEELDDRKDLIKLISQNGAQILPAVDGKVTHLISTARDLLSESPQVKEAKNRKIFIVSEEFISDCLSSGSRHESLYLLSDLRNRTDGDVPFDPARGRSSSDPETPVQFVLDETIRTLL
eukprot:TRINITY_DN12707_c0_g1_i1.p1 TRINITY_DN12707_c0_g1~~TRINITY_DN12707_c0_g1_i1.p1  ORF type:complete len:466 (-),score=71.59 TRINITY_DN12707_c0_g1_i1:64-1413(-)